MFIFLFIKNYLYLRKNFRFNINKKVFKNKKLLSFSKSNLKNWMNLTKKERYNLSKEESVSYLNKRKVLLEEIRKEYKKISKGNSEEI